MGARWLLWALQMVVLMPLVMGTGTASTGTHRISAWNSEGLDSGVTSHPDPLLRSEPRRLLLAAPPPPKGPPPKSPPPKTPPPKSPPPKSPPPKSPSPKSLPPKSPPPKSPPPAAACRDLLSYCAEFKAQGACAPGWQTGNPPQSINLYWCPSTCGTCRAPNPPPSPPSLPIQSYQQTILTLVNQGRTSAGLPSLCLNAKLNLASNQHSTDMVQFNYFDHTGHDGSTPAQRVTNAGYVWTRVGENIAAGQTTPQQVYADWKASPGHLANMQGDFTHMGVYRVGNYWTQDFGKSSVERCG